MNRPEAQVSHLGCLEQNRRKSFSISAGFSVSIEAVQSAYSGYATLTLAELDNAFESSHRTTFTASAMQTSRSRASHGRAVRQHCSTVDERSVRIQIIRNMFRQKSPRMLRCNFDERFSQCC
jgi:hypothetical protein